MHLCAFSNMFWVFVSNHPVIEYIGVFLTNMKSQKSLPITLCWSFCFTSGLWTIYTDSRYIETLVSLPIQLSLERGSQAYPEFACYPWEGTRWSEIPYWKYRIHKVERPDVGKAQIALYAFCHICSRLSLKQKLSPFHFESPHLHLQNQPTYKYNSECLY